jgi:kynurenine/2-aminoadipate aminotransferase
MAATPIAYESYLTARALARRPSPIRALMPLVGLPGMISLASGSPNPALFPFAKLSVTLMDGTAAELPEALLKEALQYSPTPCVPANARPTRGRPAHAHARATASRSPAAACPSSWRA